MSWHTALQFCWYLLTAFFLIFLLALALAPLWLRHDNGKKPHNLHGP